jgi:hypothetical protein
MPSAFQGELIPASPHIQRDVVEIARERYRPRDRIRFDLTPSEWDAGQPDQHLSAQRQRHGLNGDSVELIS